MNVLMIYPKYPVTFWSFKYALKYVSKKAAFPPLGLLTVAAMLPEDYNVRLVDLNLRKLSNKDLRWADCVMISAMLAQRDSASEVLQRCRRMKKKIIAGGPLFSGSLKEYLPLIDHLIVGEAENTLPSFLKDLKNGSLRKIYCSSDYPALSLTPLPRWDLINIKKYAALMVQYSRGCPYDCEFCDITAMFGHKPRMKSVDQFLEELQLLYDKGWRGSIFIVDDNFIGNKVAIKRLLPQVIEWMERHNFPFEFFTQVSINLADDDELISLMAQAGFNQVFIGLETPNENSLKECSKNQNCQRNMTSAIKKLQASGLMVMGGYIVGFDNDDESIFAKQIKFIQNSGVVTAMVGLLNALPNTRLWKRLEEENRLELDATGDNTDGSINFIPKMDKAKLIEGYRRIIKTIYSPGAYYQRMCQFLKYYNPFVERKVDSSRIGALMKSIFYIGILGNGITQWYYWKLFFKSLLFYRKSFVEVITLIIYGHHFRKIAKKLN